jgi:hypothetical protein
MIAPPAPPTSSPRLLDRVRWHLRVKRYSLRTEQAYIDWIRRYILFHKKRHPAEMGEKEIADSQPSRHRSTRRRLDPKPGVVSAALSSSTGVGTKARFHYRR